MSKGIKVSATLAGALLALVRSGVVQATPITVGVGPGFDFSSVQSAIDAAASGDVIHVAPGVYVEGSAADRGNSFSTGLLFSQKSSISVIGGGSENTFTDFNDAIYWLMLDAVPNVLIQGFSMWNSTTSAFTNFNNAGHSGNALADVRLGAGYFENDYPSAVDLAGALQDTALTGPTDPDELVETPELPANSVPAPATAALLAVGLMGALGRFGRCRPAGEPLA